MSKTANSLTIHHHKIYATTNPQTKMESETEVDNKIKIIKTTKQIEDDSSITFPHDAVFSI